MNIFQYININWLINKKPYNRYSDHDLFLLKLCRDLFSIIKRISHNRRMPLEDVDVRELAYIYTSYFEDVTSEIGFWQVVVQQHQLFFGKRVPFTAQNGTEYEDVFPEDLYYLSFVYLAFQSKISKTTIYPDHPFIQELTDAVFAYLDALEEVSITDFYKGYLTPEPDFFKFKDKLQWFALRSYLFGYEFEFCLEEMRYQLEMMINRTGNKQDYGKMMHAMIDDLIFNRSASFSALRPLTVLAACMHCNKKQLDNLLGLNKRIFGLFRVAEQQEQFFVLEHLHDKKSYSVLKSSLEKDASAVVNGGYCKTTLVKWGADYLISGVCLFMDDVPEITAEELPSYLRHDKVFQEKQKRQGEKTYQAMYNHFGTDFLFCQNREEAVTKINGYLSSRKKKGFLAYESLPENEHLAISLSREGHYCLVPRVDEIIRLLKEGNTAEDLTQLAWCLAEESIDIFFWFNLKSYLNESKPEHIFKGVPIKQDQDFDALVRIYKPQDFSKL